MNEDYKVDLEENEKVKVDKNKYGDRAKGNRVGKFVNGKFKYVYFAQIQVNGAMKNIDDTPYATEKEAEDVAAANLKDLVEAQEADKKKAWGIN